MKQIQSIQKEGSGFQIIMNTLSLLGYFMNRKQALIYQKIDSLIMIYLPLMANKWLNPKTYDYLCILNYRLLKNNFYLT